MGLLFKCSSLKKTITNAYVFSEINYPGLKNENK